MAVRQDGTSTQHLAGPSGSSPTSGPVTIIQWHKLNADHDATRFFFQYHNNVDGGTLHRILVSTDTDGTTLAFSTLIGGTPEDFEVGVQAVTVGKWYCYAIVRDGSDIKLYIGSETDAMALASTLSSPNLQAQGSVWRWSATGNSQAGLSPDGSVERLKVYARELTLEEIEAERKSLTPESTTDLWTYNPFRRDEDYAGTQGSNQWTFSEQGNSNFTTVPGPFMPVFVAAGAVTNPAAAAISPALPAGIQTDDILLLFLETANEAISIANSNGGTWTEVVNSPQGTGTAGSTSATRLTVFWSRYNGTQGAPTTSDSGNHQMGVILAYRGCLTTAVPVHITSGGTDTGPSTLTLTGATTTIENTLVLLAVADDWDNASVTRYTSWANANLNNILERIDSGGTTQNGGGLGIAEGGWTDAGAYGSSTVAQNASILANGYLTIALEGPTPSGTQTPQATDDTLSLTEAMTRRAGKATSDALGATEDLTPQTRKLLADAIGFTEAAARQINRAITEGVGLSEDLQAVRTVLKPLADTLGLTEDLTPIHIPGSEQFEQGVDDTLGLSEGLSRIVQKASGLAEAVGLVEALARRTERTLEETAQLLEAQDAELGRDIAEQVQLTEQLTTLKAALRDVADTMSLTESLDVRIDKALAETVALTEDTRRLMARAFEEGVALTENLDAEHQVGLIPKGVSDTVQLTEAVARAAGKTIGEAVSLTEVRTAQVRRVIAESLALTEGLVAQTVTTRSIEETLGLSEALGMQRMVGAEVADTVSLTEALERHLGRAVQDTLGLTETRIVQLARAIGESVALAEGLAKLKIDASASSQPVIFVVPAEPTVGVVPAQRTTFVVSAEPTIFVARGE